MEYQILKLFILGGKTSDYYLAIADLLFTTALCAALFTIPHSNYLECNARTKMFCNFLGMAIALIKASYILFLIFKENRSLYQSTSLPYSQIHSNELSDEEVFHHLSILECDREKARKMSRREFAVTYKQNKIKKESQELLWDLCDYNSLIKDHIIPFLDGEVCSLPTDLVHKPHGASIGFENIMEVFPILYTKLILLREGFDYNIINSHLAEVKLEDLCKEQSSCQNIGIDERRFHLL